MSFPRKIVLSLLALLLAQSCPAFDYIYNSSSNIEHWSITTPDASVPTNSFNRNTHAIRYFISSEGWSTTNAVAELNAVRNSFGQWEAIPGSIIKFEEADLIAPGYRLNASDNTNVVYWAKSSTLNQDDITGAVGFTSTRFTVPGNVILQFDIVLNGWQYGWFTDFNDRSNPNFFVESTLTHEIGHALGMNHSTIGGATLLYDDGHGIDAGAGLSADEIAFAHALYPAGTLLSTLGSVTGTVTKNGSPVLGAAVIIETSTGILVGGTATLSNGTYVLNALAPGNYDVRVCPLDPAGASAWLIRGRDVASPYFDNADTSFLPALNLPVSVIAGTTNTLNFTVMDGAPAFRITTLRQPTANSGTYSWSSVPATLKPGQSNYFIGVASASLPTNGATLSISGDGLKLGSPTYFANAFSSGLNFITVSISVASNATPGLRSFIVTQGNNRAYANGFVEVLPTIIDYNFDGLDDVFQRKYFAPFTSTNAAPNADPDHDGMSNYAEYIAGTDPTSAASALRLTSVTQDASGATLAWPGAPNHRYQVSFRTNPSGGGSWQNLGGIVTTAGSIAEFFDSTATNGNRFYRVQALP